MAKREIVSEVIKETRTKTVAVSDFSGVLIPNFHWQTITQIRCYTQDGCGNRSAVFELDLMPEEMEEFRREIHNLISQLKRKYSSRRITGK